MKQIAELIEMKLQDAFEKAGYDAKLGKVKVSDRPDLCEYQCNGAMAGAKVHRKAPVMIANDVTKALLEADATGNGAGMFEEAQAVNPGFINLKLSRSFVADYVRDMGLDGQRLGVPETDEPKKIIIVPKKLINIVK